MFYGAGAGGQPTASAVLGDIVAVARNLRAGMRGPEPATYAELPVVPMADALTRYYVCLDVADRPGVLAPVAESFARRGVSIKAVHQEGRGEDATLIIVTHTARESALARDGRRPGRHGGRQGGRQRAARRGRGGRVSPSSRVWRGVIGEYGARLPADRSRRHAGRGRHAAAARARAVGD